MRLHPKWVQHVPMQIQVPKAVADWVSSIQADSHKKGYDEGYQQGWDAATKALIEAAKGHKNAPAPEAEIDLKGATTNAHRIFRVVEARPGLKPSEVVKWFETHTDDANADSILTTIKRMRKNLMFEPREDSLLFLKAGAAQAAE